MIDKKVLIEALDYFTSGNFKTSDVEQFYKKLGVRNDIRISTPKDFKFEVYNNFEKSPDLGNLLTNHFVIIRIEKIIEKLILDGSMIINSSTFKPVFSDLIFFRDTNPVTNHLDNIQHKKLWAILRCTPSIMRKPILPFTYDFFIKAENFEIIEKVFHKILKELTTFDVGIYYHDFDYFIISKQRLDICECYLRGYYDYVVENIKPNKRLKPDMTNGKLFKDFDITQHEKKSLDNLATDSLGKQKVNYDNLSFAQYKEGCILILNFLTVCDYEMEKHKPFLPSIPSNDNLTYFLKKYNFRGMEHFTEHIGKTFGKNRKLWDESARTFFSSEYAVNYFIAVLNKIRKIEAKQKVKEIVKDIQNCRDKHNNH